MVLQGGYTYSAGYLHYSLTSSQKGQNRSTSESVTTFTYFFTLLSFLCSFWGIYYITPHYLGSKGWCSGERARLPPMWPGFKKSRCRRHMWVEFVVGSLPFSERFSPGSPVFPSPQKATFPNSSSTRNQVDEEPLCGCATSKSLFIFNSLFTA